MQNETTVSKWGNSLAIRLPQGLAKEAGISQGDALALSLEADGSTERSEQTNAEHLPKTVVLGSGPEDSGQTLL